MDRAWSGVREEEGQGRYNHMVTFPEEWRSWYISLGRYPGNEGYGRYDMVGCPGDISYGK